MPPAESDWKSKYLKVLDQLERIQQLERARHDVLKRGLVRVSVAAHGQDAMLDQHLEAIRAALRNQREVLELDPMLGELEQVVKVLDGRRRQHMAAVMSALDSQLGRYIGVDMDRASRRKLLDFRKRVPTILGSRQGALELLRHYSGIVEGIIRHQSDKLAKLQAPPSKGWRDRLSEWWHGASDEVPMARIQPSITDSASAVTLVAKAVPSRSETAEIEVVYELDSGDEPVGPEALLDTETARRLSQVMAQMLRQMDMPAALQSRRDGLLSRLDLGVRAEDLPALLADVSDLLMALRADAHAGMDAFLIVLYQRLQDIHDFMLNARTREAQAYVHQQQLAEEVRSGLSDLRDAVAKPQGTVQVRADIERVMARIMTAMADYQKIEADRRAMFASDMERVDARLKVLEHEASELRARIDAERVSAQRDLLTDLPNRIAYEARMEAEHAQKRRVVLALIVLDDFQGITDVLGYLRGDKILRLVAREMRRCLPVDDFLARYGGQTFVVLSHETDVGNIRARLDGVRQRVMDCPFNFNGERVPVTVSIGVVRRAEGESVEGLFERADTALRQARTSGGNRLHSDDSSHT